MIKVTKIRGLMLIGTLLLTATVAVAEGRCYTAEVPQTMVLPDGSTHAPGLLRICLGRTLSPVSILHRTDVGGRPMGMFLSVPRDIEVSVEEGKAQFIFKRNARGELALVGYAIDAGSETQFFDMERYGTTRRVAKASKPDVNEFSDAVILIAAGR